MFFTTKRVSAHRASWGIFCGDIPDGLQVLHACDTPCCVNPAHLFLGTNQDNVNDKVLKGRQFKGEQASRLQVCLLVSGKNSMKLTDDDVLRIRQSLSIGGTLRGIAEKFGVTNSLILKIKKGIRKTLTERPSKLH
jgi:hypothetical protein